MHIKTGRCYRSVKSWSEGIDRFPSVPVYHFIWL
jgi:hypothetical protein